MGNGNSVHVQTDRPYFLVGDVVTGTVHLNVCEQLIGMKRVPTDASLTTCCLVGCKILYCQGSVSED